MTVIPGVPGSSISDSTKLHLPGVHSSCSSVWVINMDNDQGLIPLICGVSDVCSESAIDHVLFTSPTMIYVLILAVLQFRH